MPAGTPHQARSELDVNDAQESLRKLREALRLRESVRPDWKVDGAKGEDYAREWMRSRAIEFVDIPQERHTLSEELKGAGGKRPDFVVSWPGAREVIILFDAKHRDTLPEVVFRLDEEQIKKYVNLEKWGSATWPDALVLVVFIVVEKGSEGKNIYIVGLNEVLSEGTTCEVGKMAGRSVALAGKQAEW